MLINDLDLRITKYSRTYYPWKLDRLNPGNAATNNSDNSVDNVEQVYIENSTEDYYTITVSHKGTLVDDTGTTSSQQYGLIISGIGSSIPIPDILPNPTTFDQTLGLNETAQQTLSITNDGESGSSLIYNIIIEENGSRNISGSTFTSLESDYESDTTFDLHLTIYNASTDDEWLDGATLTFPAGVTVNSSTNFIGGGAGALVSNGETGGGVTITWSDENGGYGNIYAGQSASATVNITVDSGFSGDLDMDWTLSGDNWGSNPHDISGTLTLTEYTNLTLTSPNGNEFWANGSDHNITWDHFGVPIANVKLELSSNNGVNYSDITTSTPNDGIYEWTVSGNVSPECLIRISDSTTPSVNDISNDVFRIYNTVDWITLDQDNGILIQGVSDNITLTFNSTGLAEGTYNANIEIISNDPDEVTVILPVELIVEDNPLPVTLSNFFVEFEDNISSIFWTTQSELNNMGWNIYRSPSQNFGQAFQLNSELIPGAGTTTEPTDYNFL